MKSYLSIGLIAVFGIVFLCAIGAGLHAVLRANNPIPSTIVKVVEPPATPQAPTFASVQKNYPTETLEIQVTVFTKQVELYTQEVNVYTQHIAASKTYLEASTADESRFATAFTLVIKDTLLPIASTILTALVAFAFAAVGGQALQTLFALRGIADADKRKELLKELPKIDLL